MKKILLFILLVSCIGISISSVATYKQDNIVRIEIYYYGWDVMTRSRLGLDDVRKGKKIKISIFSNDEIKAFIDWLEIDNMDNLESPEQEDPRLVIDLVDIEGNRHSYYASRFSLLNHDSTNRRPIDDQFRNRFTFEQKNTNN